MKNFYFASLCRRGLIGGAIYFEKDRLIYICNKLTLPAEYRRIEMPFANIVKTERGRTCFLPSVTIEMKNGDRNKFIVCFMKSFAEKLAGSIPTETSSEDLK